MLLYHGSNTEVADPRLLKQTRGLDFGHGFYATTNEKQAKRFAKTVRERREIGTPIVSVFEYNMDAAIRTLAVCKFEHPDTKWFQFVVDNRRKIYQGKSFDIVVGPVANDDVMPTIQGYLSGFISKRLAMAQLKASRLVDQVCLKTEEALSFLRYIRSFEVKGSR